MKRLAIVALVLGISVISANSAEAGRRCRVVRSCQPVRCWVQVSQPVCGQPVRNVFRGVRNVAYNVTHPRRCTTTCGTTVIHSSTTVIKKAPAQAKELPPAPSQDPR